jgi:four helix bundle protein
MNHKDLDAWRQAMSLAEQVYIETKDFPKTEQFGLTSQLRRAAVSVAANIAEGAARNKDKQLVQFLYISLGSQSEVETLILLSFSFGYITEKSRDELLENLTKCMKLTHGLIKYLRNKTVIHS